jgi:hypothetical protein
LTGGGDNVSPPSDYISTPFSLILSSICVWGGDGGGSGDISVLVSKAVPLFKYSWKMTRR